MIYSWWSYTIKHDEVLKSDLGDNVIKYAAFRQLWRESFFIRLNRTVSISGDETWFMIDENAFRSMIWAYLWRRVTRFPRRIFAFLFRREKMLGKLRKEGWII